MTMAKILCATRGGEASYRAQDAAIALAQEREDDLLFLYVVNLDFLDRTARAVRPDIVEAELEKLGAFLLEMARVRAEKQGLTVQTVLRHGSLIEALVVAAQELQIDTIAMGKPAEGGTYSLEELRVLADNLENETGLEVRIL
jgi:nucleotide-binding universal stress UspA family protein